MQVSKANIYQEDKTKSNWKPLEALSEVGKDFDLWIAGHRKHVDEIRGRVERE